MLSFWQRSPSAFDDSRWVVLDVEANGLDTAHDRLHAIDVVGVRFEGLRAWFGLADSFEVVLRQNDASAAPNMANILLHCHESLCQTAVSQGADSWVAPLMMPTIEYVCGKLPHSSRALGS